jgi:hypothetical protein
MVMAKISKKPDAPEGDIKVSIGMTSFKVKDGEPYETDDLTLVEQIEASYSDFFDVEHAEEGDQRSEAKAEAAALKELHKTQERAKIQHATKDPLEAAAPVPTSLADLQEIKEEKADDKDGNN